MNYVSYWGGRNHFVFVGDSRMRQLYLEFVGLLSKESLKSSKYHGKLSFSDAKTNVLVVRLTFHVIMTSINQCFHTFTFMSIIMFGLVDMGVQVIGAVIVVVVVVWRLLMLLTVVRRLNGVVVARRLFL